MLKSKSTKSSPVKMKQPFFPSIRQKTQIKQYRVIRRKSFINNSFDLHPLPQLRRIRRQSYQEGCSSKKIQNRLFTSQGIYTIAYKKSNNTTKQKERTIRQDQRRAEKRNATEINSQFLDEYNPEKQKEIISINLISDKKYEWLLTQMGRQSILIQTEPKIVVKRDLSSSGSSVSSIPLDAQETQRQGHEKRQFTLLNLDKFKLKPITYQRHLATTDRQDIPFVKRQITQFSTTTKASNTTNLYLRLGQQQIRRKV